jgi:hypothetical protein
LDVTTGIGELTVERGAIGGDCIAAVGVNGPYSEDGGFASREGEGFGGDLEEYAVGRERVISPEDARAWVGAVLAAAGRGKDEVVKNTPAHTHDMLVYGSSDRLFLTIDCF